jgi:hypothetical protein
MATADEQDRSRYQDRMDPAMIPILRAKSPWERLEMANAMWRFARDELTKIVRGEYPTWRNEAITREVASRLLRGEGELISMDLSSFIRS